MNELLYATEETKRQLEDAKPLASETSGGFNYRKIEKRGEMSNQLKRICELFVPKPVFHSTTRDNK